jgi:site-specific DNA recombinase
VRDLIEKSRRGMEESVRQGWHTGGRIPYGFMLEEHAHPNPHKAREGKKKHRLVPDPVQAPIVLMVFEDYCLHGLGLGEICDKLNRDLDRYPPPRRNPKDEMALPQTWSRSQVQAMLRNPKYTGYNVWGRHNKRRGRPYQRPRDQWVWSATPVHEPIVPKELFDMVEERARRHEIQAKKTPADYPQRRGRRNGRFYPLRGRVRCALCGRRMEGSFKKGSHWYRCRFKANRGGAAADAVGHPRALSVKEDAVIEALVDFMGRRLFGPDRLRLLQLDLSQAVASSWGEHDRELTRLKREREEVERSLRRQALRLEEHDDPRHPVVAAAKLRIEELAVRRATVDEAIEQLGSARPVGARPDEIEAMLDAVPDLRPALASADPEKQADIFERFDVMAVYDKPKRRLQLAATVAAELAPTPETPPPPRGRWGISSIAGAGFEPATFGL